MLLLLGLDCDRTFPPLENVQDGLIIHQMLLALVSHPQRVVTRDQLLDWTRGRAATPFDRAVDVQLSRLRRKIGDDPREPALIRTVRGDGYMFAVPVVRC